MLSRPFKSLCRHVNNCHFSLSRVLQQKQFTLCNFCIRNLINREMEIEQTLERPTGKKDRPPLRVGLSCTEARAFFFLLFSFAFFLFTSPPFLRHAFHLPIPHPNTRAGTPVSPSSGGKRWPNEKKREENRDKKSDREKTKEARRVNERALRTNRGDFALHTYSYQSGIFL